MVRTRQDVMDPKVPAILCTSCGGWPALFRPSLNQAYCESCQSKKAL